MLLQVWRMGQNAEGAKFVAEVDNQENSHWCGQMFDMNIIVLGAAGIPHIETAEGHQQLSDWRDECVAWKHFAIIETMVEYARCQYQSC